MKISTRTALYLGTSATLMIGTGLFLSVDAEPPAEPTARLGLVAPGRVEPAGEEREIGPRVPGILRTIDVDENDRVEAGQVLAELDRADLEAQLRAAKASVELERTERARLIHGARPEERREAKARLDEADAHLTWAAKEHARQLPLRAESVITDADLDRSTRELEAARARRAEAAERLASIQAPARTDEVAMADAQLELALARVAMTEAEIEKTYVRSPISGTILRRLRKTGEAVGTQPPTPLFVVGDLSALTVRAEVDELDVARIHAGDRAYVTADAWPGKKIWGSVTRVGLRVGGKSVLTDRPSERHDRKVLDAMITLDPGAELPVGLRVDVFID